MQQPSTFQGLISFNLPTGRQTFQLRYEASLDRGIMHIELQIIDCGSGQITFSSDEQQVPSFQKLSGRIYSLAKSMLPHGALNVRITR